MDNPVYLQLMRDFNTWPDEATAKRITWIAAVAGTVIVLALISVVANGYWNWNGAVLGFVGLVVLFSIFVLAVGLMLTAIHVGHHATPERLATMALTRTDVHHIVQAYIDANRERVRLFRAMITGLFLPMILALTFFQGSLLWNCRAGFQCVIPVGILVYILVTGLVPALLLSVGLGLSLRQLDELVFCIGVWLGMRWQRLARSVAVGVLLAGLLALGLLGWFVVQRLYVPQVFLCAGMGLAIAAILFWLTSVVRKQAIRIAERILELGARP